MKDMLEFVATIHIITCVILVGFVLLQNPKGGALGILGGQSGSKSVFSGTGASDFLVTVTKWCAVVFAFTSIQLAYMNTKKSSSVILDAPVQEETLPASPTQEPVPNSKEEPSEAQ
ncbi:MAG: preprotein translocase subunit SecG [Bdellovibrionales bacterium]|nr:preprotein translocase subunit SecG [Bdellovibrionales bacterium]